MAIQPLCHHLTQVPKDVARNEYLKATLYSTAAKAAMVAVVAICAFILAISLGLTPIATIPLSLAFVALLGPLALMPLATKLQSWANEKYAIAEFEQKVADQLDSIEHWNEANVQQFLDENQIQADRLPLASLAEKSPDAPLKALLPLIARYRAWVQIGQEAGAVYDRNWIGHEDSMLEYEQRRIAWKAKEERASAALQGAVLLQQIQNPVLEPSLDEVGSLKTKPLALRVLDILLERPQVLFGFKQEGKAPLTLTQIEGHGFSPVPLRPLLFA